MRTANPKYKLTYDSLDAFVEAADIGHAHRDWVPHSGTIDRQWAGGMDRDEIKEALANGWTKGVERAAPIRDEALDDIRKDAPATRFTSRFDVAGSHVDMGRYLSGHPENMRRPVLQPISKVGRVVTLVASGIYSASVSSKDALKRSALVTALAMALEDTGHATELWLDFTTNVMNIRLLVKGTHDVIDPERLAAAYHPAVLRQLSFDVETPHRPGGIRYNGVYDPDPAMYPEGAIILPSLYSGTGYDKQGRTAAEVIKGHLIDLGLLDQ